MHTNIYKDLICQTPAGIQYGEWLVENFSRWLRLVEQRHCFSLISTQKCNNLMITTVGNWIASSTIWGYGFEQWTIDDPEKRQWKFYRRDLPRLRLQVAAEAALIGSTTHRALRGIPGTDRTTTSAGMDRVKDARVPVVQDEVRPFAGGGSVGAIESIGSSGGELKLAYEGQPECFWFFDQWFFSGVSSRGVFLEQ